jgi:hypothetical protein
MKEKKFTLLERLFVSFFQLILVSFQPILDLFDIHGRVPVLFVHAFCNMQLAFDSAFPR